MSNIPQLPASHTFAILQHIKSTDLTIVMLVTMEMAGMNKGLGRAVEWEEEAGEVATTATRNLCSSPTLLNSSVPAPKVRQNTQRLRWDVFNGLILQNLIKVMCLFIISIQWHVINIGSNIYSRKNITTKRPTSTTPVVDGSRPVEKCGRRWQGHCTQWVHTSTLQWFPKSQVSLRRVSVTRTRELKEVAVGPVN